MKILFVAYQFPPLNIIGARRPYYFAKYLHEHGIYPTILTLDPNDYDKVYSKVKIDHSLLDNDTKLDIRYIRSTNLLAKRKNKLQEFLSIYLNTYRGSEGKYWAHDFIKNASEIVEREKMEAIFVTAPPFSILPLVKKIARKYNLPFYVDMRDPWALWVTNPYPNYLNFILTKRNEYNILKSASTIIATSPETIKDFEKLHNKIDHHKYRYIPNGFNDEIKFEDIRYEPKSRIRIGYVGSFYYDPESRKAIMSPFWKKKGHKIFQYVPRKEDWLYRSPFFFLRAIHKMICDHPETMEMIEIHFAGPTPNWLKNMVSDFNLEKVVTYHGFLNHADVISLQKSCDFLLLTSAKVINGYDYSIAGKTYEYFDMKKSILGFVCDGAQKEVLVNSGLSVVFNPDEVDFNAAYLYQIFVKGFILKPNLEFLNEFRHKTITRKLADVLRSSMAR